MVVEYVFPCQDVHFTFNIPMLYAPAVDINLSNKNTLTTSIIIYHKIGLLILAFSAKMDNQENNATIGFAN